MSVGYTTTRRVNYKWQLRIWLLKWAHMPNNKRLDCGNKGFKLVNGNALVSFASEKKSELTGPANRNVFHRIPFLVCYQTWHDCILKSWNNINRGCKGEVTKGSDRTEGVVQRISVDNGGKIGAGAGSSFPKMKWADLFILAKWKGGSWLWHSSCHHQRDSRGMPRRVMYGWRQNILANL